MITDEEVLNQVQFLASCYPNLKWDGVMTAGAWSLILQENNVEYNELEKACRWIVNNGIEEFKVNIALVIDLILQDRKIKYRNNQSKQYLDNLNKTKTISKEKFTEYKNKLFKELYGDEKE